MPQRAVSTANAARPGGPYSQAVVAGDVGVGQRAGRQGRGYGNLGKILRPADSAALGQDFNRAACLAVQVPCQGSGTNGA